MAMNTTSLQINISKRSLCFLPLMDHQSTDRGNLGGYRPPLAPRLVDYIIPLCSDLSLTLKCK